ncbi:MAG: 3-hydroxyacyl-CoA dehydrogenase NAD-binding domain-containing protein [Granulosicoccus sp.]
MTSTPGQYKHWQIETDSDDIVWLACDREGESSNTLSTDVLAELKDILSMLESSKPDGLVLYSAKPENFILGADINEFDSFTEAQEVSDMIREGHKIFLQLENLPCHKVAAVHGFALGGGLELALCCDCLLALNDGSTRLGFPEVKLGIFPGLGGTTRLTEKLGGMAAMQLMLTGKMLRASAARRIGLVDQLVDEFSSLRWAARKAVLKKQKARKPSWIASFSNYQPARSILAGVMKKKTAEKASPLHYPAPFKMIDLWREHRGSRQQMFDGEARLVGELMVGETARNLRRLFFLTERMKSLGKAEDFSVQRVHVVGAGVMGGDIAAWAVLQGCEVTLQDRSMEYIEPALKRAKSLFRKRLRSKAEQGAAAARLIPDVAGDGVPRADVIIEAIFEDVDAKRALYAEIEPRMASHAILASNTSALTLEELSRDLHEPQRLIGLHFFNPVAKMPLVEVVHGSHNTQNSIDKGCAFCTQINRFPLPTLSKPGFLVNRVLAPYLMEAFTVLSEGVDKTRIDAAAVRFGMPMGPIELADVVGLDVCMQVAKTLASGDVESQRSLLQAKIDAGNLGKKSGSGFYEWQKGRAVRTKDKDEPDYAAEDALATRLLKPFLQECEAASAEGVVADDDLLDAGIVFGTGFAPFKGGPMNYLSTMKRQEQA